MYRLFDSRLSGNAWKVRILLGGPLGALVADPLLISASFPVSRWRRRAVTWGAFRRSRRGAGRAKTGDTAGSLVEEA